MACCTTIPPLNNKRKSGGIFDLPRSAKQRRPLNSPSTFLTSTPPNSKSTMFVTAASAQNKQIFIEADTSLRCKTSVFQASTSITSSQDISKPTNESPLKNELMERIRHEAKRLIKRKQLTISNTSITSNETNILKTDNDQNDNESSNILKSNSTTPSSSLSIPTLDNISVKNLNKSNDMPLFSMNQVNSICERLINDRESALREEYDKILAQKMSEQYDQFVKFTHEQIQRRFANSQCSYVS